MNIGFPLVGRWTIWVIGGCTILLIYISANLQFWDSGLPVIYWLTTPTHLAKDNLPIHTYVSVCSSTKTPWLRSNIHNAAVAFRYSQQQQQHSQGKSLKSLRKSSLFEFISVTTFAEETPKSFLWMDFSEHPSVAVSGASTLSASLVHLLSFFLPDEAQKFPLDSPLENSVVATVSGTPLKRLFLGYTIGLMSRFRAVVFTPVADSSKVSPWLNSVDWDAPSGRVAEWGGIHPFRIVHFASCQQFVSPSRFSLSESYLVNALDPTMTLIVWGAPQLLGHTTFNMSVLENTFTKPSASKRSVKAFIVSDIEKEICQADSPHRSIRFVEITRISIRQNVLKLVKDRLYWENYQNETVVGVPLIDLCFFKRFGMSVAVVPKEQTFYFDWRSDEANSRNIEFKMGK